MLIAAHMLLLAGENTADKSYVINALLGEELLPCYLDTETAMVCQIAYDKDNWSHIHYWDGTMDPILLRGADGGGFGEELGRFIQATDQEMEDWPYKKAEVFTQSPVIKVCHL